MSAGTFAREEQAKAHNLPVMEHILATIDMLIATELLCRTSPVTMLRLLTERELKVAPVGSSWPVPTEPRPGPER